MTDLQFLTADRMDSLEQYGASLLTGMISIRSLESFHITAMAKGFLDEDEDEACKTLCWEMRRLMKLYLNQYEKISSRCQINEDNVLDSLKSLMPQVKKPRKRKII